MASLSLSKINKTALAERRTHKKISMIMNIMLAVAALLLWMVGSNGLQILGMFLFSVGLGIGVIASVSVFRELTNSQLCDVKMSLPMSNLERYLSRLLTLCYIHVFPLMAYGIVGLGGMYFFDKLSDGAILDTTFVDLLTAYLVMLALTLFVDGITVFCTTCCGALAESVYFSIIAMGCLSVAPGVMYYRIADAFGGMSNVPEFIKFWTFSAVLAAEDSSNWEIIYHQLISILISVLLFAVTYLIFKRRDASSVGDPIAFKLFFELIMALGVFTVYSAFICTSEMKIGVILTTVIYLVINIIVIRAKISIKRVAVWLLKLAATSAVFMAIVFAGFMTDGFGIYNYMPIRSMNGNSIEIQCTLSGEDKSTYYSTYNGIGDGVNEDLSDEQIREALRIVRKYGITDKTSDRFFGKVSGNDDWGSSYDYCYVNVEIYKHVKKTAKEYGAYVSDHQILDQSIIVKSTDLDQMYDDIEAAGIEVNREVNNWTDYSDDYGEVVY